MTDEPDLTERQEQVLWALMGEKLAADIDPTETGGLADDELAQHLGVSEEEIRHDIQALINRVFVEHGPAESAREDDWFRQVECDWQWSDGRYCNMTVHFYALAAGPPQGGRTDVEASLAGYCSLEHATATPPRRWPRPGSCMRRSSRARPVSAGSAPPIASASRRSTNSSTPIRTRSR